MKKIFTLLLSSLFSLSLLAHDGGRLSVSVVTTKINLKIDVDGKKYSMQNNSFTLESLNEGSHSVKIYTEKKRRGQKQEVLFNKSVLVKSGYHTDITVNQFGKVFTDEQRIGDDNIGVADNGSADADQSEGLNGADVITRDGMHYLKEQIRNEYSESTRLIVAETAMEGCHYTTKDLKDIMLLFTYESNRLEIAKFAYSMTVDKENYYQLKDVLTS